MYSFYIDGMRLPVAPESLKISVNNRNETINLINDGEVNLLKSAGLTEISFEFLIPIRDYAFANTKHNAAEYLRKLEQLKVDQAPFQFIVYRSIGNTKSFKTNIRVSLESYETEESAENTGDIIVSVELKQYRDFSTKILSIKDGKAKKKTKKTESIDSSKIEESYTVKSGDTLWSIAKLKLGDSSKWKDIYKLNKSEIEKSAKEHGYKSSSNGHWIFPGTKLRLM